MYKRQHIFATQGGNDCNTNLINKIVMRFLRAELFNEGINESTIHNEDNYLPHD